MHHKAVFLLVASMVYHLEVRYSISGTSAAIYGQNCTEEGTFKVAAQLCFYNLFFMKCSRNYEWCAGEQREQSSTVYQCRKNRYYPMACRQNDTLIEKGHIRTTENFLYECSELTPGRLRLEIVACRLANLSQAIYPGEKMNISSEVTATCEKIPAATKNGTDRLKLKIAGCIDFSGVYVADGALFTNAKGINTTCDIKGDGVTMESLYHHFP